MTYCVGIKTKSGLIALADTRISSGLGVSSAKKIYFNEKYEGSLFLMTSGLRSIRDKVVAYFDDKYSLSMGNVNKMYKAVNLYGEQVKRVAIEDEKSLKKSHYSFDIHTIIGGQLKDDAEHKLFLVFPEGNWVEVTEDSPYALIGNINFGKPILKRKLTFDSDMETALKLAFISFDAARNNVSDVDFPIDTMYYGKGNFEFKQKRYTQEEMLAVSKSWSEELIKAVDNLPNGWTDELLTI